MAPDRGATAGDEKLERLDHVTGARCLASTWIVCGHFLPALTTTSLSPVRYRADVAVSFFIVMSGFITHWVYAPRLLRGGWSEAWRFYARRLLRVLVTTWFAMLCGLGVVIVQLRGGFPELGHLLRCWTFVESWVDPLSWCPNGQTWTVAALLPSWLLYPVTCRAVETVERRAGSVGLLCAATCLWLLSFGPVLLLFWRQHGRLSNVQGMWSYIWPPAQMPDFLIGVVAAALARRRAVQPQPEAAAACGDTSSDSSEGSPTSLRPRCWANGGRGLLADACVAVIAAIVFATPPSDAPRQNVEVLFYHGLSPLMALFLYASSYEGGCGMVARLMRHEALVACGEYSFEVYLFQYPLHEVFVAWGDVAGTFDMRNAAHTHQTNSCGFMAFFLSLWLVAGLYAEWVESYLIRWLRAVTTPGASTSSGCLADSGRGAEDVQGATAQAGPLLSYRPMPRELGR